MMSWKTTLPLTLCIALVATGCPSSSETEPEAKSEPAAAAPAAPAATEPAPAAAAPAAPAVDAAADKPEWIIWADGDPWDGKAPLEVAFECDLMEEIEQPKYEWDFGDGSPKVNESHPKHTYQKAGQFTATCRVTDPSGGQGEDSVVIDVE
jgi:hypothetical protein